MNTQNQALATDISTTRNPYAVEKSRARIIWSTLAKDLWLPVLFLAGVAVFNFVTLMNSPSPFVDEAWYANRAYALVHTGFGFGTLDSGIPDKIAGYWTVLAWIQPLIESIPIHLFGLSLFAVRLESLFFGIALLAVIYAIVKRLYSSRAAMITIVIGAFSDAFLYSSHLARPDIQIALCGFGAVALYLYSRSSGLTPKSVLSGLIIGLAVDIHPNIVLFVPVILGLFFLDFKWQMFRTGRFWGFVIGASMGVAFYVAIHILPYPASYMEINRLEYGLGQTPLFLRLRPDLWALAVWGTALLLGIFTCCLLLGAFSVLVKRRSHADKQLLVIFAALVGSYFVLRPYWPSYYMILIAPPAWLLIGALIDYLCSQPWVRTPWVYTRTVVVVSLVLLSSLFPVSQLFYNPGNDWDVMVNHLRETIPPNSKVMGEQVLWFARPTQPYLSWEQLGYYKRYSPGHTLTDAFSALGPDYLIMDAMTDSVVRDNLPANYSDYYSYFVPKPDMDLFMKEHCRLVSKVTTPTFGTVRIYKIVW